MSLLCRIGWHRWSGAEFCHVPMARGNDDLPINWLFAVRYCLRITCVNTRVNHFGWENDLAAMGMPKHGGTDDHK